MARIQGVPQDQAGPILKLVYRFMRRGMKQMTGRAAAHGSGIEPLEVWAREPKMTPVEVRRAVRPHANPLHRRADSRLTALLTVVNHDRRLN
jgi:hypothetical protein